MPRRARSRTPAPARDAAAAHTGQGRAGGGRSNAEMQERLRQSRVGAPLRDDPGPWAAQQRSVSFQPVRGGELFRDGATAGDVVQGQNGSRYLGDCWLLASLAALAHTRPQVLEDAVTDHGDGTYTVRLFRVGESTPDAVRVSGALPQTANGRDAYSQRQDPAELWVGIIEKAFASWMGGYGKLDGGIPGDALTALTGEQTTTVTGRDAGLGEQLRDGAAAGAPMVAASAAHLSLAQGGIVPGHAHTVLDVTETGGQTWVTLRDPFAEYEPGGNGARDGVFKLTLDELQQRFQYVTIGGSGRADRLEGGGDIRLPWED